MQFALRSYRGARVETAWATQSTAELKHYQLLADPEDRASYFITG